jgi:hypothetical protein
MIDVTDGAYVHVRLAAIKFLFRHWSSVFLAGAKAPIFIALFGTTEAMP